MVCWVGGLQGGLLGALVQGDVRVDMSKVPPEGVGGEGETQVSSTDLSRGLTTWEKAFGHRVS